MGAASVSEPKQLNTLFEEPMSHVVSSDMVMRKASRAQKRRGWPKGKPRSGTKKATVVELPAKLANRITAKANRAKYGFAKVFKS